MRLREGKMREKIRFNRDEKYDLQLSEALVAERRLGAVLGAGKIERIELKTETWQWEQTENIAIEYRCDGRPSGISVTEADVWVHELRRDGETLVYLWFPIGRLKELARAAIRKGRHRRGGDDGRFDVALVRLKDILR
jgi:hypothetical protein